MLTLRTALVLFFGLAVPVAVVGGLPTPALQGAVRVVDGDTLAMGETRIRLFGIDAPEALQRCDPSGRNWACGVWSADKLREIVTGAKLICAVQDTDRYGRSVASCSADGRDVGSLMVRAGAAIAYRAYSQDYVADENLARAEARGLWNGAATDPSLYRRIARHQPAPKGCAIKGNVSSRGSRIYHLPGQRDYDATRISPPKGEQYFCSEAEAVAAGFRAAKR